MLKRHTARQRSRSPAQDTQVSNPPASQAGTQDKKRASKPAQSKMSRPTSTTQASQVTRSLSVNASPFVPQVQDQDVSDGDDGAVGAQDGTPLTSPHHPQMSSTPRNVNQGARPSSSSGPHVSFNPQPQVMQQSTPQDKDRARLHRTRK